VSVLVGALLAAAAWGTGAAAAAAPPKALFGVVTEASVPSDATAPGLLYSIHPATGAATLIGQIHFNDVGGIDIDPRTGVLYALGRRPADGRPVLLTIDRTTGAGTEVAPLAPPGPCASVPPDVRCTVVADLAFRSDGTLFGESGALLRIDLLTGAVTLVGPSHGRNALDSIAFTADEEWILGRGFEANLFTVDPATGAFWPNGWPVLDLRDASGNGIGSVSRLDALDTAPGTGVLWGVTGLFGIPECFTQACLVTTDPSAYLADPDTVLPFAVQGPSVVSASGVIEDVTALAWACGAGVPAGTPVSAKPVDCRSGAAPVTLTFSDVSAAGGVGVATGASGPPPPAGFKLGNPPTYYAITTTAVYSGPVRVCIMATGLKPSSKLFHFEDPSWVDTTVSLDLFSGVICGEVASLSPFAVLEAEGGPPPDCSGARPSQASLWPPDHRFVPVAIEGVTDAAGAPLTAVVTAVMQDEPVSGPGDGNTRPDAIVDGAFARLRAERAGTGDGRVYTVSFSAAGPGGACAGSVAVGVPHDRSHPAVDDGAAHVSTVPW
jgi:hypothetical protein